MTITNEPAEPRAAPPRATPPRTEGVRLRTGGLLLAAASALQLLSLIATLALPAPNPGDPPALRAAHIAGVAAAFRALSVLGMIRAFGLAIGSALLCRRGAAPPGPGRMLAAAGWR